MEISSIKTLLIEDEEDHISIISGLLDKLCLVNVSVETARTFQEAKKLIEETRFDLILSDLMLPDSAYHKTLERLTAIAKDIPIIVLTSLDDKDTILGLIKNGADDCIPKIQLSTAMLERVITYNIDRHKEKQVIKQSEAKFRNYFEKTNAGYVVTDLGGKILDVNPSFCNFIGYDKNEITGKNISDITFHEDLKESNKAISHILEDKTLLSTTEKRYVTKNGTVTWGRNSIQKLQWKNNKNCLFFEIINITERKTYEAELEKYRLHLEDLVQKRTEELTLTNKTLKESEEKYRDLYDNAPDMFLSVDIESSKIIDCNKTFTNVLGYTKDEIINLSIFDVYHASSIDNAKTAFIEFKEKGKINSVELQLKCKNGKIIDVSLNASAVKDNHENTIMRSIWRDITRNKEFEAKIKHLASFPKLDNNPILEINLDGEIIFYNNSAVKVLKKAGPNKNIDIFLPKDIINVIKRLRQENENQIYREVEIGNYVFNEYIQFITEFKVIRIYTSDITENKKAEKKLKETHNQLIHSEKLSAIGKLSASIAHEFNNPICGIRNVLESIADKDFEHDEEEKKSTLVNIAIQECNRMANLIKKLQDFHRPTTGFISSIDINQTIEDICLIYKKKLMERNIKLEIIYKENNIIVDCVADQIKQVLLNIIQNAEESISSEEGEITITVERKELNVLINVKDSGNGIERQHMSSIFEPFFTTKSTVKGTGLGLAICYGIIKKHNGDIKVENNAEQGTTFTIILPTKGGDL